jgi:hypothetical protein
MTRRRATHIWPKHKGKERIFLLLRRWFGDEGRIAEWTRGWKGPWVVRSPQKHRPLFSHEDRERCIEWERRYVRRKLNR